MAERGPRGCDAPALFGSLAAFALLTPLALWACPSLLREPTADVGEVGEATTWWRSGGGGLRLPVSDSAVELTAGSAEGAALAAADSDSATEECTSHALLSRGRDSSPDAP